MAVTRLIAFRPTEFAAGIPLAILHVCNASAIAIANDDDFECHEKLPLTVIPVPGTTSNPKLAGKFTS